MVSRADNSEDGAAEADPPVATAAPTPATTIPTHAEMFLTGHASFVIRFIRVNPKVKITGRTRTHRESTPHHLQTMLMPTS
jgi:hypothetical protein